MKKDTPHHRLYKQLKGKIRKWEDLTPEEKNSIRIHYPHLFQE